MDKYKAISIKQYSNVCRDNLSFNWQELQRVRGCIFCNFVLCYSCHPADLKWFLSKDGNRPSIITLPPAVSIKSLTTFPEMEEGP